MKTILSDKQAFATPLLLLAYQTIEEQIFDLEPETIGQILKEIDPKTLNRNINKVNAALSLIQSNLFWQDPVTFGFTCRVLNRCPRVSGSPPNLDDIMWGVTEARLITGDPNAEQAPFSESIKSYVEFLLKKDSIVTEVPTLNFVDAPEFKNVYDDPEQQLSVFDSSKERVNEMEQEVGTKMVTMLKQIKDLHLDISKEAAKDLESLLENK